MGTFCGIKPDNRSDSYSESDIIDYIYSDGYYQWMLKYTNRSYSSVTSSHTDRNSISSDDMRRKFYISCSQRSEYLHLGA